MNFVEACRQLISIDSTPSQGNRRVVDWLEEQARAAGLSCEIQEDMIGELPQANLLVRPQADRQDLEMMFQSRLETPDPGPFGLWKENASNPFDAHIIDGKIFGLGVANCKLDFLCKLEALKKISSGVSKWKLPPVLVGTFGSETGMTGALKLIRKNLINAKLAVIGEPSNLRVLSAGKGTARVHIRLAFEADEIQFREAHNMRESTSTMSKVFQGQPAPSANPSLGDSAIKKMFSYLAQLPGDISVMEIDGGVDFNTVPAHAFLEIDPVSGFRNPMARKLSRIAAMLLDLEEEFLQYNDSDFFPPHPTLNIGSIRTYESYVELQGDVKIPAIVPNEVYDKWMERAAATCHEVGGEFQVNYYKRPYRTDNESSLVKGAANVLQKMGLDEKAGTHSSTNEASLFSRVGIECISFGPGQGIGNIHTPRENVSLDQLTMATDFYCRLLERFCK